LDAYLSAGAGKKERYSAGHQRKERPSRETAFTGGRSLQTYWNKTNNGASGEKGWRGSRVRYVARILEGVDK